MSYYYRYSLTDEEWADLQALKVRMKELHERFDTRMRKIMEDYATYFKRKYTWPAKFNHVPVVGVRTRQEEEPWSTVWAVVSERGDISYAELLLSVEIKGRFRPSDITAVIRIEEKIPNQRGIAHELKNMLLNEEGLHGLIRYEVAKWGRPRVEGEEEW